ncbi:hypothetical protein AB4J90_16370 [Geobacillus thermodenitrificans]|jgi:hypothetical protein|uniref:hypothetical protein n=1 Tax=Geobacillus thermodenitrificans TaxID=33940 RepID=UPI0034C6070F
MELERIYSDHLEDKLLEILDEKGDFATVDAIPNECPICNITMKPIRILGLQDKNKHFQYIFKCSSERCQRLFIASYRRVRDSFNQWKFVAVEPIHYKKEDIDDVIKEICPEFESIYNEAKEAELRGLMKIAGMGYRKSLEFLIKDYLIHFKGKDKEEIEKKFLGNCIKEDIDNYNVKQIALRAAWLGNDESHYVRQWKDKNIEDLKLLLRLSMRWIVDEIITNRYIEEMEAPKR